MCPVYSFKLTGFYRAVPASERADRRL